MAMSRGEHLRRKREQSARWRIKNRDLKNQQSQEYRAKNALRLKAQAHGLEPQDLIDIFKSQDGVCAICKTPGEILDMDVDHDHRCCPYSNKSNKQSCGKCVRGLTCKECNRGLGAFRDNPKSIERAIDYLARQR